MIIHELEMNQQRKAVDREMELTMKRLESRAEDRIVSLFEQKIGLTPSPSKKREEQSSKSAVVNDDTIYRVLINSKRTQKSSHQLLILS